MPVTDDKAALRKLLLRKRNEMLIEHVHAFSRAAQEHILALKAWRRASSVALYMAVRKETDASLLREKARKDGKEVFLPYTVPSSAGIMHLLPCPNDEALVPGAFGILEPSPETCPLPPEGGWVPDLIVTPGVAFDAQGFRIGMGGGYYDRLFAKPSMRNVTRIGLAYSFQIVDSVPVEEWDLPMHAIATEQGVLRP